MIGHVDYVVIKTWLMLQFDDESGDLALEAPEECTTVEEGKIPQLDEAKCEEAIKNYENEWVPVRRKLLRQVLDQVCFGPEEEEEIEEALRR